MKYFSYIFAENRGSISKINYLVCRLYIAAILFKRCHVCWSTTIYDPPFSRSVAGNLVLAFISCCDIYALCECTARLYVLQLDPFFMFCTLLKLVILLWPEVCWYFYLFLYLWRVFHCNHFLLLECKWQNNHRMLIKSCWLILSKLVMKKDMIDFL